MKKIFLLICFSLLFFSCASVKNLNDYDKETLKKIEYSDSEILGKVSSSTLGFTWTKFYPNSNNTKKLLRQLEKKAISKYGKNIKLVDVDIGSTNGLITGALWGTGGTLAVGSALLNSTFEEENSSKKTEITNPTGYYTTMGVCIGSLTTFLFKGFKASATVIKSDETYTEGDYILISEEELENKQKISSLRGKNTNSNISYENPVITNQKIYGITTKYDKFKDVTFIESEYLKKHSTPMCIYISKTNSNKYIRLTLEYRGTDWIFFDKAILINNEGNRLEWSINSFDKDTQVLSGSVYEHIDLLLDENKLAEYEELITHGTVELRLSGKYYKDYTLNEDQINAILQIINTYKEL